MKNLKLTPVQLMNFCTLKRLKKKSNKALSSQQSNFAFVVKNELY